MPTNPRVASLGFLADNDTDLLVKCSGEYRKVAPCPVFQFEPGEYLKRWGREVRLCDLEARYACPNCGAPVRTDVVIHHAGRRAGGFSMKGRGR